MRAFTTDPLMTTDGTYLPRKTRCVDVIAFDGEYTCLIKADGLACEIHADELLESAPTAFRAGWLFDTSVVPRGRPIVRAHPLPPAAIHRQGGEPYIWIERSSG